MDLLIKPLSVLEFIRPDSKCLVIGPRNEYDLFTLVANGWNKKSIKGLDLISYSPLIDIGDMHNTPYPDNSWDTIIVGWTLSYSSDPKKFAEEIVRIARNGSAIAIGVEFSTMSQDDQVELIGYCIQENMKLNNRVNAVSDILNLFADHVQHVYFSHDAPLKMSHTAHCFSKNVSNVAVIFQLRK